MLAAVQGNITNGEDKKNNNLMESDLAKENMKFQVKILYLRLTENV